jgi:hypothetical protein
MSSYEREPLTGVIRQENRVVGSVCLPEEDQQEFIDQFNHCYGPLRLRIEIKPHQGEKLVPARALRPVGAVYQPRKR